MTARQREVLSLLASGMTRKEVAAHLYISEETVRNHLRGAYTSLGIQTEVRGQTMLAAFRALGWLRPPTIAGGFR